MEETGWIKVYRKVFHEVKGSLCPTAAWIWLLLAVEWREGEMYGTLITTTTQLARAWNWQDIKSDSARKRVRRQLIKWEQAGQISTRDVPDNVSVLSRSCLGRVAIKIVKYREYQGDQTEACPAIVPDSVSIVSRPTVPKRRTKSNKPPSKDIRTDDSVRQDILSMFAEKSEELKADFPNIDLNAAFDNFLAYWLGRDDNGNPNWRRRTQWNATFRTHLRQPWVKERYAREEEKQRYGLV